MSTAAHKTFQGIMPPLSTLFDADGNFDAGHTGELIEKLIATGVDGVLLLGSAGEFFSMTTEQRKEVAAFCLKKVAGRITTLVGTGACGTQETIELSRHAAGNGADGVMVINPYYSPMSDDCLFEHYKAVADACPCPVFLYNFPAMTGQDLSVELIARLADASPNIRGLKDSVASVDHTRRVILEVASKHPGFAVFSGFDEHVLNNLALGGAGGIPGTANFAPQFICGLYKAFKAGDYEKAYELHKTVAKLSNVYGIETPYFGTLKEAAKLCVMPSISTAVLPPSQPLTAQGLEKLKALLSSCDLV